MHLCGGRAQEPQVCHLVRQCAIVSIPLSAHHCQHAVGLLYCPNMTSHDYAPVSSPVGHTVTSPSGHNSTTIPNNCLGSLNADESYRIYLVGLQAQHRCLVCLINACMQLLFTLLLGPFTFFNVQKTKLLQLFTSVMRWTTYV